MADLLQDLDLSGDSLHVLLVLYLLLLEDFHCDLKAKQTLSVPFHLLECEWPV